MGVKYSGKIISSGKTIADYKESETLPQGTTLIAEYDASENTFPVDQGWNNSGGVSGHSIVNDDVDGELTLRKVSVSGISQYASISGTGASWLCDLEVRIQTNNSGRLEHYWSMTTSGNQYAFELFPDSIRMYTSSSYTSPVVIAYYDFQTQHVQVKLLYNTDTNKIHLYLDGQLITDQIDIVTRTLSGEYASWGDGVSGGGGSVGFWRSIQVYDGWTE